MAGGSISGLNPALANADPVDIKVGSTLGLRFLSNDGSTVLGTIGTTGIQVGTYTKFTLSAAAGPATAAAGDLTGAPVVVAQYSAVNGSTLTVRTAAQMIADASLGAGNSYLLRIVNSAAGTCTLTTAAGVTLTGKVAIATNTYVDYVVTVPTATTMVFQSVGTGTQP